MKRPAMLERGTGLTQCRHSLRWRRRQPAPAMSRRTGGRRCSPGIWRQWRRCGKRWVRSLISVCPGLLAGVSFHSRVSRGSPQPVARCAARGGHDRSGRYRGGGRMPSREIGQRSRCEPLRPATAFGARHDRQGGGRCRNPDTWGAGDPMSLHRSRMRR